VQIKKINMTKNYRHDKDHALRGCAKK